MYTIKSEILKEPNGDFYTFVSCLEADKDCTKAVIPLTCDWHLGQNDIFVECLTTGPYPTLETAQEDRNLMVTTTKAVIQARRTRMIFSQVDHI